MANGSHKWRFFRAGGFDQVKLDRGSDIANLEHLDQTLWVALACPTRGIEFDYATLDLIDTDKDGRIRAPEIIAAAKWAVSMLKDADQLVNPASSLHLSAINDQTPEGKGVLASAKQILVNLGKSDAEAISIEDVTDTAKIFAQTQFNGDGVIPADAASDEGVKKVIEEIIAALGSEKDRSGKPGITQPKADLFFADLAAYAGWWEKGEKDKTILPIGVATAGASAAVSAVRAKIDDYFARCNLAAFDARALMALNREEKEYLAISAKDLTITSQEIAALPISKIEAKKPLSLAEGINPAWGGAIGVLVASAVKPLLGDTNVLTEADWEGLKAKLAPYQAWSGSKPASSVEKIPLARIKEILASNAKTAIAELIAKDKALEPEANAISAVDRLVRYKRDLVILLRNFVNFRIFYERKDKAVFQVGRLYLDQRACDLAVRVEDAGRHGAMAHLSYNYLAYCDIVRKSTGEKMSIAAAFTAGDSDNLMVGRNGIFYDRNGHDWDATITKIVDNPISIRQAFWSPYKKLVRFISETIAKRAAAADADATSKLQSTAAAAAADSIKHDAVPPKPKFDVGTLAAIGLVLSSIVGFVSGLFMGFLSLGVYMPLGFVALMLLISGPSMLLAWLKLRQRNVGPILDANGWAVNAKAKINIPFGRSLTRMRAIPPGSEREFRDPYQEKNTGKTIFWILVVLAIAFWACWNFGLVEKVCPGLLPPSGWMERRAADEAAEAKKKAETAATQSTPTTAPATTK